jgi:hypothetical protein
MKGRVRPAKDFRRLTLRPATGGRSATKATTVSWWSLSHCDKQAPAFSPCGRNEMKGRGRTAKDFRPLTLRSATGWSQRDQSHHGELVELVVLRQASARLFPVRAQQMKGRVRLAKDFRRLTLRSATGWSQRDHHHHLRPGDAGKAGGACPVGSPAIIYPRPSHEECA